MKLLLYHEVVYLDIFYLKKKKKKEKKVNVFINSEN